MSEKQYVHIDVLGNPTIWDKKNDKCYIQYDDETTIEICDLLNTLTDENEQLKKSEKINMEYAEEILEENHKLRIAKNDLRIENGQLKSERRNDAKEFSALFKQNFGLKRRLDYEKRMHKQWKDDCLAILEEQDLNDYIEELQKSKKNGWDSEPNTDYVTRVKEGLK